MKFYLLPVGQAFEYQGKRYTKSGPLTASLEGDGRNKLIPRSADVQATDSIIQASPVEQVEKLDKDRVVKYFTLFHDYCIGKLDELSSTLSEQQLEAARSGINKAYQESLASILESDKH
jgi:hypothetical protein